MTLGVGMRRSLVLQLIAPLGLAAIAQLLLSGVLAQGESTDHARIHAMVALFVLLAAGAIVVRWPSSGLASRAPAAGLAILAVAQLIESVGAYGFDASNGGERTDLAVVHDLGLGATALGLLIAVAGIAIGLGVVTSRLQGRLRWAGMAGTIAAAGGGLLFVKTMIGM